MTYRHIAIVFAWIIFSVSQTHFVFGIESKSQTSPEKYSLVGEWRSNTELTLKSLDEIENISEDSRSYLKKNIFGRLTVEFTETETRSYFGKDGKKSSRFVAYKILEQNENHIKIENYDPLTEKQLVSTLFWEQDCYYELAS